MNTGQTIRFILEVLVFIAWAFMAYRTFATLRERDAEAGDGGGLMAQFKQWMRNEEDQQDRKTLFFLTFVLVAMLSMNVLTAQ